MDLLKINWDAVLWLFKQLAIICGYCTAITLFVASQWKLWLKKWWQRYEEKKNKRWNDMMIVQDDQIKNQDEMKKILDKITLHLYGLNGTSIFGKMDKVLKNQSLFSQRQEADWYLDETPIIKSSPEGKCIWVNLAYIKMSGFDTAEQALGTGAARCVHPDDVDRVVKEFMGALHNNRDFITHYRRCNLKDMIYFPVTVMARVIRDDVTNEVIETVGVIHRDK